VPHLQQFGRFEIIRKLGRSMTDVYLALDPQAQRRVVLKIVEESADAFTQLVLEAERRGAAIQKQLHEIDPRVVEVYETGEHNGCFFVAMEYVEGRSITEILHAEKRLDATRAARYAAEVCSQLEKLHSFLTEIDGRKRAVVHGDIKPSNIQITPNDEVRLLDFGIAKAITFTHNLTHHNLGSPSYCSPERLSRAQVDHNADLWALGVTLYEMVAGSPPYQAQNTRKLENLIQSRRPPRALPEHCPPGLKAIIRKALSADIAQRYASASAFENDLRLFLRNRPAAAEAEHHPSWEANETIEKAPPQPPRTLVSKAKAAAILTELSGVIWALMAGLVLGLIVLLPAGYLYRFWMQSAPLRAQQDYARKPIAGVNADWGLYKRLESQNAFLGGLSPLAYVKEPMRANLINAADEVIEHYRNSSNPALADFEWGRTQSCLERALEIDPSDRVTRGKLALCEGYAGLAKSAAAAKAAFERASSYMPRSPDPHLGLARVYVYSLRNVGRALAELHEAERLGFHAGPREFEQEADGYLFRAEQELAQAQKTERSSHSQAAQYARLAEADLERARALYEPIAGFSNVSLNLDQLYRDRTRGQLILEPPAKPARAAVHATKVSWRKRRWR
jgi:Ser/Thr protein kinase RdoA (MazF antagonist)